MGRQETITRGAKYKIVARWIKDEIGRGALQPGTGLESESQLCERFGVSRGPVRQALNQLETERLIYRVPGKGTFVREHLPAPAARLHQINVLIDWAAGSLDDNFVVLEMIEGLNRAAIDLDHPCKINYQFNRFTGSASDAGGSSSLLDFAAHSQGLLVIPFTRSCVERLEQQREMPVPIVSFFDRVENPRLSQVFIDHEGAARRATELLRHLGHRRIAFLLPSISRANPALRERLAGYRQAMAGATSGSEPGDEVVIETGDDPASMRQVACDMLSRPDRPTGIVLAGGELTAPIMQALRDAEVTAPGDVSLIVCDDTAESRRCHPPLSVIRQPLMAGVRSALEMLVAHIADPGRAPRQVALDPELVVRGSCSALRPNAT